MADRMTVKEAAKRWGLTERRITGFCRDGRIEGARKQGRVWMLPACAEKPIHGKQGRGEKSGKKRDFPLPVGISDYRLASSAYYYVNKTLMIRDFTDSRPLVSLFTRPRCFGKTLNMDMLRTFTEAWERSPC